MPISLWVFESQSTASSVDERKPATEQQTNAQTERPMTESSTDAAEKPSPPLSPSATSKILGKVNEPFDKVDWSQAGPGGQGRR